MLRSTKKQGMNAYDCVRLSLIGLNITIVESRDPGLVGVSGTIVDETKQMIKVKKKTGQVLLVPKGVITFSTKVDAVKLVINGKRLIGTVNQRLKQKKKIW